LEMTGIERNSNMAIFNNKKYVHPYHANKNANKT